MIKIQRLYKSYSNGKQVLPVLDGVSLEVAVGQLVAIMGSSGSGKSTLLNILGLLDRQDSGVYQLAGETIADLTEKQAAQLRNRHLGFVFQSFNLLPFKTAQENVALPLYYQKVPRKERNRTAMDYLERVGLLDRATHLPGELSGGQKQRVALARALITNPKVILADEPTGALDSNTSAEMMQLFKDVHAEGKTIVIVTHEDDIAAQTERVIRLKDGKIINDSAVT